MKLFSIFIFVLGTFSLARAEQVSVCNDGNRSFIVNKNPGNTYTGEFQDFTGEPKIYDCQETGARNSFQCTREDYIATVRVGADGSVTVSFELTGDFGLDSGYLYSLSCD